MMHKTLRLLAVGAGVFGLSLGSAMGQLNHRYSFNDDTANDSVGSAHGTLVGDASIAGGQVTMNLGVRDGIVDLPAAAIGINGYSALTLEVWATPNATLNDAFSTLLGFGEVSPANGDHAHNYVLLQTHRGDDVSRTAIALHDPADGDPWTEETGANGAELNDDAEHHYAAVITSSEISLYVDGVLAVSNPNAQSLSGVATGFAWLGDGYPADQNWAGSVNELRIYGNAVPDWAIAANSLAGPDGAIVVPEPATFALAGFGLLSLLMLRRRA